MPDERIRIEVSFEGGQTLSVLVLPEAADRLEQALGGDRSGAIALEAEDGRYTVVLAEVVYLKRFAREARVGFGST